MPTYNVTYTPSTGGSLSAASAGSATTLGLLYTDAHLAEWRNRANVGPYKSAGDSFDPLIPGEWDRIVSNKNTFAAAPTADRRQTWEDITDNGFAITEHMKMLDAAFYALVKEDSALATVVKDELMWEATRAGEDGVGMQISPTRYLNTDGGNWWNGGYMLRMVMIADFVKDSFSTAERTTFNAWISDWAYAFEYSLNNELAPTFGNRYDRDYSTNLGPNARPGGEGFTKGYAYQDASGVLHNQVPASGRAYNNRKAVGANFFGLASVFLNDAVLKDRAKLYVEEYIRFHIFPDGSMCELQRNDSTRQMRGLNYTASCLETATWIAEALRLDGDSGLYNYSTTDGLWGSECTTEPAKTLKLAVDTYLDLIDGVKLWYLDSGSVTENDRIDNTDYDGGDHNYYVNDLNFAPIANRFWKDDNILRSIRRENPGSVAYANSISPSGSYGTAWGGTSAAVPSILFMFADMEDVSGTVVVVNPDVSTPITSTTSWQNRTFGTQSDIFNVEFDIVPHSSFMNGTVGLSLGSAAAHTDLGVILGLNAETGVFNVRNGGAYDASTVVTYTAETSYHVRIVGNTATHTYSVFIAPDGGAEVLLANNFAFRTEQNTIPSLDNLAIIASIGSHTVSNFTTGDYVAGQLVQTVTAGEDAVAVTATPDTGYGFTNWTGDRTSSDNPFTVTNVQADTAVTANFTGGDQTLTYTAGAGGSVTGTSPQTVAYGADGTAVTAVPDTGYSFVDWSDSSTQNPRTDTSISADVTVTANFAINTFTLTYSSGANGSLTGTNPQTIDYNTNGTAVTAVPATGYIFADWSDGSTDNPRTDSNIVADLSVSASFVASGAEFTVTFAANGGSITGDTSQLIVSGESCTAVTVVPNANYTFTQWSDANTDNPRTLTNVTSTQTLTATCVIDTYSVDFTAGAGGSITGTASQTIDHGSDATQVTATAALYYEFAGWSGGYVGGDNPLTITNVTEDLAIAASFTSTAYDYTASTLSSSTTSVNADGSSTSLFTVQVKEDGVNATSGGHEVALTSGGGSTISSITDNGDGTYTATVVNSTIESVTVSGTVNTEALANTKSVAFTSGAIRNSVADTNAKGKIGGC